MILMDRNIGKTKQLLPTNSWERLQTEKGSIGKRFEKHLQNRNKGDCWNPIVVKFVKKIL